MIHPAEQIVADAIMSGDTETGLRQITCNAAASMQMTCQCGDVLDQSTVHVLESIQDGKGKTLAACCKKCAANHAVKLSTLARMDAKDGIQYRWQTWKRTIPIEPMANMEIVHIGDKPAPAKPRIPSIHQIVRGKEQSARFKPLAIAILEKHGLVLNAGTMIIAGRPCNPSAIVDKEIAGSVDMWAWKCKGLLEQPIDELDGLSNGGTITIDDNQCRRMIGKSSGKHIATVNELFRRTAEKHGNVYRWYPSIEIGDNETGTPSAMIGVNTAGERTAVIACVIDEE